MKLIPAKMEADPLDHLESADTATMLAQAMESLGPRERQVLAMHFGLDGHEAKTRAAIAAELDMLTESVEWALNRASPGCEADAERACVTAGRDESGAARAARTR
jgi:DNA-directed RNA polymerase sigma subunit (sigma70/sigma32)